MGLRMTEQAGRVMGPLRALSVCYPGGSGKFAELLPCTEDKIIEVAERCLSDTSPHSEKYVLESFVGFKIAKVKTAFKKNTVNMKHSFLFLAAHSACVSVAIIFRIPLGELG